MHIGIFSTRLLVGKHHNIMKRALGYSKSLTLKSQIWPKHTACPHSK